jgi:uncharacterized protein YbaA (DUF1428 family)
MGGSVATAARTDKEGLAKYGEDQKETGMSYVDGYVLPISKKKLPAYRRLAATAAEVWREYGALEYRECVGDDLKVKWGVPFSHCLKLKRGETVVFSWIVFKSRADRDRINNLVMKDPRIAAVDPKEMPFDDRRMVYGGFKVLVDACR